VVDELKKRDRVTIEELNNTLKRFSKRAQ